MTDQPASLAAALIALQADIPRIRKTARGQHGAYADLEHVTSALLPRIARLGLAFTAWPTLNSNGRFVLAYKLLHISGESETGEYELPTGAQPQQIGSAITYARRYSLLAVTGVAPAGDDDDGRAARQGATRRPRQQRQQQREPLGEPPVREPHELPRNQDGSISRSQATDEELDRAGVMTSDQQKAHSALRNGTDKGHVRGVTHRQTADPDDPWAEPAPTPLRTPRAAKDPSTAIVLHFDRLGVTDRDERLRATKRLAERDEPLTTTKELTAAQGGKVLAKLGQCRDRGALIALLAEEVVDA